MRKKNQTKRMIQVLDTHEKWLTKLGINDQQLKKKLPKDAKGRRLGIYDIPDYRTDCLKYTSNEIPAQGAKKPTNTYTGTEIMGISVTHKSNLVPIRKDNPDAAKDIAAMRR